MKKNTVKTILKKIRTFCTSYISKQTSNHLKEIRLYEMRVALKSFPSKGRLLEIGGGTGWQAKVMQDSGYCVSSIDIPSSNLKDERIWPVTDYNGKTIPFSDNTFDIIFSSNVLEHIAHIHEFQLEIQRVLKPEGVVVHVLPSSSWRFWSNITEMMQKWRLPLIHGEQAPNAFVEVYFFSRWWWKRLFYQTGWVIESLTPLGLFYTGSSIMDDRLSIKTRERLSFVIGSACDIYILYKK